MTRLQRRNLEIWLKFRDRPMTVRGLLWANRRTYLIMLIGFGLLCWLIYTSVGLLGSAFVAVAFAIAVLRDLGYFIRSARAWPVLREVIDWNKVETLRAQDDSTAKA
jgi:Flp pilus assembly protein TadB